MMNFARLGVAEAPLRRSQEFCLPVFGGNDESRI